MITDYNSLYREDNNVNDIVNNLCSNDSIFQKIFSRTNTTLTPAEREEIEVKFKNIYPNEDLDEILKKFLENSDISQFDECNDIPQFDECSNKIYDPQAKKFYNPKVLSPIQRSKTEQFNVVDFLREEQQRQRMLFLNFDTEQEIYLDVPYEEKKKNDIIIDYAIKSIAKLALILNQQRKDIPYTILEVHNLITQNHDGGNCDVGIACEPHGKLERIDVDPIKFGKCNCDKGYKPGNNLTCVKILPFEEQRQVCNANEISRIDTDEIFHPDYLSEYPMLLRSNGFVLYKQRIYGDEYRWFVDLAETDFDRYEAGSKYLDLTDAKVNAMIRGERNLSKY
ncbi:baculo_p74_N domain-containing protein [Trichonephila clavipes]|nr:baculo_p74_N domain-containing protein [Trichonephila clavipes]